MNCGIVSEIAACLQNQFHNKHGQIEIEIEIQIEIQIEIELTGNCG
jgi:hypothetical protein